jgi:hypothetical protein
MFLKKLSISMTIIALVACGRGDDSDDSTDSGTTDSGTTDSGDTEPAGFSMSGDALDLGTFEPAAEGLCIYAADPTAALGGGAIEILAGSQIGADGAFTIEGVVTTSGVGLFMVVQDCDTAPDATVMPTATGVAAASYAALGDGDALTGLTMLSINNTLAEGVDASLQGVGYTGSIVTDGMMAGFVRDNAGAPIAGATVSCVTGDGSPCAIAYYADAEPEVGGLFAGAAGINTSTVAETGGLFMVPGAPIFTYSAAADGYVFQDQLFGSVPGLATFMTFVAD